MKILIVDDNEENLYMLSSLLGGNGFETVSAENGETALKAMEDYEIDMVISDVLMPVMDGFAFCRQVRSKSIYDHIPIIIYTATYTGPQDEILALELGADKFVIKPCYPDVLLQIVKDLFAEFRDTQKRNRIPLKSEEHSLKLYNERLVRKLEQKMLQTEQEIEARKLVEQKLRRNEAILNSTQAIVGIGGWEWDNQTKEIFWTPQTYKIHELEPNAESDTLDYLIKTSLQCYPQPDGQKISDAFVRCCETGEAYEMECNFITLKGRSLFVQTAGQAVMEDGKVVRVQGYIQDITERKIAEQERERLRTQLYHTQKLESIGQLAGGIAHDFNNILAVILGYSEELLKELDPNSQHHRAVSEIAKAGNRANSLTRQLLAFSKKTYVDAKVFDLNALIKDLSKMLKRIIGEDIKYIVEESSAPAVIKADVGQIEQILLNLVINARDAMPGGGSLRISTRTDVSDDTGEGDAAQKYIHLCVQDSGIGIAAKDLARIFEPFFSTKDKTKNSGLGLPTVYGIVEQNKGKINVQSEPGKGTMICILWPQSSEPISKETESTIEDSPSGNNQLILLVEDDPAVRNLIRKILTKKCYKVIEADSAENALRLVKGGLQPDLLVSDVIMGGMDGYSLYAAIKEKYPQQKALLISGYSHHHNSTDDKGHNIPFIQKPFTDIRLTQMVGQLLKEAPDIKRLKLLMIDDDEDMCILMQRVCNRRGHILNTATNSETALNLVKSMDYDLIISDANLQGESGISVIEEIRSAGIDTPAMILSGAPFHVSEPIQRVLGIVAIEEKTAGIQDTLSIIEKLALRHRAL